MSEEAKRYNGWANYETWCVHLWLTNDEGSYRYWRDEARRHRREWGDDATRTLGEQLKSELEEASPIEEASLFSDLLNAALGEVDWSEVADAFLEEVEPEDEDDQAEEGGSSSDDEDQFAKVKRERLEGPIQPRFEMGRVVSTPGVLETVGCLDLIEAVALHLRGYWGEVSREDWEVNDTSLIEGSRLLSVYRDKQGETFWIITEADRSATTVLLPSEY